MAGLILTECYTVKTIRIFHNSFVAEILHRCQQNSFSNLTVSFFIIEEKLSVVKKIFP